LKRFLLLLGVVSAAIAIRPSLRAQEELEITDLDVGHWDCLQRTEGTPRDPDAAARNRMKNRPPIDLTKVAVTSTDIPTLLRRLAAFDSQTQGKGKSDLTPAQKQLLDSFQKEFVSLTGWLVLAYPGGPESTNCKDADFHDWHLEVFENFSDHPPRVGDPTPLICEITPRTERTLYRDRARLQSLAGFIRLSNRSYKPTGHKAQKVRITGYLMWDDDHNEAATDIGKTIRTIGADGYHHPWRSTAWEVHPALKIELADAPATTQGASPPPTPSTPTVVSMTTPVLAPSTSSTQQFVTVTQALKVKVPYGEMIFPIGLKLPVISHDAQTVTVKYMGGTQVLPISATDLH